MSLFHVFTRTLTQLNVFNPQQVLSAELSKRALPLLPHYDGFLSQYNLTARNRRCKESRAMI